MNRSVALPELPELLKIDALRVVEPAAYFEDSDHLISRFGHQAGSIRTHITKTLYDDPRLIAVEPQFFHRLIAHHEHAASGGLAPSARSADVDRLARHHRRYGLAGVHRISIHHPRHDLFVGVHVGRGHILFRSDEFEQLRRVAPRHALQFTHRHFVRIADDATLRAAERNVNDRALPRHPARQSTHFVQIYVWRIANPALRRPARDRMLNPIP